MEIDERTRNTRNKRKTRNLLRPILSRVSPSQQRADIAVLSIIVLFFAIFFRGALFGGKFFIVGDALVYSYPLRTAMWEMIRQGSPPLWTPLILSGYPFLSMAVVAIGYPLTWGYLFLPGYWAEQVFVLAPYLLAPIFTYAYAREVGRSHVASLLAGLSFGYGGLMFSPLGSYGFLSNAVMWTPLLLIAVERARTRPFIPCLLLATFAYAMSVFTGIGQGFTYVGALILAYAVFVSLLSTESNDRKLRWSEWERWKPLAVAAGGITLAAGVAAFQIRESLRAARLSVRHKLSYEHFSEGSFTFSQAWKSVLDPIHNLGDVTTYVSLLVILFACAALIIALRDKRQDRHIIFWFVVAIAAFVFILGSNTPLYPLVHQIPFINRFRVPSRHSFEWTFALSMMASYGWDAVEDLIARMEHPSPNRREWLSVGFCLLCLLLSVVIGIRWWMAMKNPEPDLHLIIGHLNTNYLSWKIGFTFLVLIAVWQGWRVMQRGCRLALLSFAVVLGCFIEPLIGLARWVEPFSVTKERFDYFSPVTRLMQKLPPGQNRVYPQRTLPAENHAPRPLLDPLNWTVMSGLHSIAGYEPLMMERYSRALNSMDWDSVNRGPFLRQDLSLFEPRSHVLDLLNVTIVATYSNLAAEPEIASLHNSTTGESSPRLDAERWEIVYQQDGVILLRNRRALPRAWLVTQAEAVDQTEAWAMIRGQGERSFDPQRTALLELEPSKMPALSGHSLSPDSYARIVNYEPNRLVIETNSNQQAVLVLSEMHYPGWMATLDGQKAPIHQTDFLLRGMAVPAGKHYIEMSYKAPGARSGAIISTLSILLIAGIAAYSQRIKRRIRNKRK